MSIIQKEKLVQSPAIILTESEMKTLKGLQGRPLQIELLRERIDEVHNLVAKGLARLAVVQCAWGVEIQVELTQRGHEQIGEI